jgi:putative membrane protein
MNRPILTVCTAVLLSTSIATAFGASDPTSKHFVKDAIEDNLAEIKASELALTKSDNPAVKSFAQQMIDDHTKSNTQLETAAARYDIKVPDNSALMQRAELKMLQMKSGADFDKSYVTQMRKDHEKALELFKEAANSDKIDPDLKALASNTLPTIERHEHSAMQLAATEDTANKR